jgi:hypothetical protein
MTQVLYLPWVRYEENTDLWWENLLGGGHYEVEKDVGTILGRI